jgi:hypothetical protein
VRCIGVLRRQCWAWCRHSICNWRPTAYASGHGVGPRTNHDQRKHESTWQPARVLVCLLRCPCPCQAPEEKARGITISAAHGAAQQHSMAATCSTAGRPAAQKRLWLPGGATGPAAQQRQQRQHRLAQQCLMLGLDAWATCRLHGTSQLGLNRSMRTILHVAAASVANPPMCYCCAWLWVGANAVAALPCSCSGV